MISFLSISFLKIQPSLVAVNKESDNLDKKIAEIKKTVSETERLGGYLNSNAYFERQARLKLNYKKLDERVVYVYPNPTAKIQNRDAEISKTRNRFFTNFGKWLDYLLK